MDPLPIIILALVGCGLSVSAYKTLFVAGDRGQVLAVIRAWRWRYLPGTIAALFGVVFAAGAVQFLLPWTDWGWWQLLGGEGNPVFGKVDLGSSPAGQTISALLAVTFPLIFCVAAIREARSEEVSFRKGNQIFSQKRRVARALWFGLIHCIIGIPICVGFALAVTGGWLDYVYQRGYEREMAKGSRETARASLLGVLRARRRELAAQKRWPVLNAYSMPASLVALTATQEDLSAEVANAAHYENFEKLNDEAEEAGVNAAAAQHAFYNLLIIVIVEVALLSS